MYKDFTKYEVYEDGRIWSYSHKKWLKPFTDKVGYQRVHLSDNECKIKTYLVHRVVWEAVTGEPIPKGYEINHRNEIKTSNFFANLELVSHKQNINWGSANERRSKTIANNKNRSKAISKANTNNPKLSKSVGAFKDGELVMVFPSTAEAGRNGFDKSAVSRCCNGKWTHYKGFEWRYI